MPQNVKRKIIIQQVSIKKKKFIFKIQKMKVDFFLESFFTDLQNQIYNSDLVK